MRPELSRLSRAHRRERAGGVSFCTRFIPEGGPGPQSYMGWGGHLLISREAWCVQI